jgi:hypothetical protein
MICPPFVRLFYAHWRNSGPNLIQKADKIYFDDENRFSDSNRSILYEQG